MANRYKLLKGLGVLFLGILCLFVLVFFYTYFTGGEPRLLTFLGGEGVGVLLIEGSIDKVHPCGNTYQYFQSFHG